MDETGAIDVAGDAVSGAPKVASASTFRVVGIGASAGGLQALEILFDHMPNDTGMAFVVVQHLSPDFRSLMDELIAHHTLMPVRIAEDHMPVLPNTIYLIPPNKDMIVSGGRLLLSERDRAGGLSMPIDVFFRSLAEDYGKRAVGIILSGTGSDGSRGVRAIREAGGVVLAQNEESAQFSGMPRSAIATGVVQRVATPDQLPQALLELTLGAGVDTQPSFADAEGDPLGRLFELLRERYGVDFAAYKSPTVLRRIERRLALDHHDDLAAYVQRLEDQPEQRDVLFHDLLIGVTRFFRDPEAFARLEQDVIPELIAQMSADNPIRVWCAGCASGEEAYSLAMLFHQAAREQKRPLHLKLFATDVHRESLSRAAAGVYDADAIARLTPAQVEQYFTRHGDEYAITPELRRFIVFSHHDILHDPPFTRLHLIACRNLLIYLEYPAQKKILSLFHFALRKGGTLFLGPSETIGDLEDEFEPVDRHWRIYKKRREIRLGPPGLYTTTQVSEVVARSVPKMVSPIYEASPARDRALLRVYDQLLESVMPPTLVVTEYGDLVHTIGDAGRFLDQPRGRSTLQVTQMVHGDLKIALSTAMQRALRDDTTVVFEGVRAETRSGPRHIKLVVQVVRDRQSGGTFFRISFDESVLEAPPRAEAPGGQAFDPDARTRERIEDLEHELRYTKEHLQAAVEELEASNEELQSTNEELMASNEELQSTNEELHSVNEELYTVNAEYEEQIKKLTVLTDDMDNLLRSTEIGTIFVDQELRVRRFTPAVGRIFRLVPHDIGRPFEDIKSTLVAEDLVAQMRKVLVTGETIEREARTVDGSWLLVRLTPYRTQGETIAGAVLSMIDVTSSKATERAHTRDRKLLRALLDHSSAAIMVHDEQGRRTLANRRAEEMFGPSEAGPDGPQPDQALARQVAAVLDAGTDLEFDGAVTTATGELRRFHANCFPFKTGDGSETLVGSIVTDSTDRYRLEAKLRENEHALDTMLEHLTMQIALIGPDGTIVRVNEAWRRFAEANDYRGRDAGLGTNYLAACVAGEANDPTFPIGATDGIRAVLDGRRDVFIAEYPCDSPSEKRWFRMVVTPFDFDGRRGAVIAHLDLSDLRESRQQLRRARQYLDLLYRNGRSGILVTRAPFEPALEFASANVERWLGHTRRDLELMSPDWTILVHPEDRAALLEAIRDPTRREVRFERLRLYDRHGAALGGAFTMTTIDDLQGNAVARAAIWTPDAEPVGGA